MEVGVTDTAEEISIRTSLSVVSRRRIVADPSGEVALAAE
jgi:hypothetical protein